jgi:hypothetical protein
MQPALGIGVGLVRVERSGQPAGGGSDATTETRFRRAAAVPPTIMNAPAAIQRPPIRNAAARGSNLKTG